MALKLNRPLRTLCIVIGVLFLVYALHVHLLVPGLTLLLLIFIGALFIAVGLGRIPT
jgi:hypothetical protein